MKKNSAISAKAAKRVHEKASRVANATARGSLHGAGHVTTVTVPGAAAAAKIACSALGTTCVFAAPIFAVLGVTGLMSKALDSLWD